MKFKLFEIIWDLTLIAAMIHFMIGGMVVGLSFFLDTLSFWQILLWLIVSVIYVATAESFMKKIFQLQE